MFISQNVLTGHTIQVLPIISKDGKKSIIHQILKGPGIRGAEGR